MIQTTENTETKTKDGTLLPIAAIMAAVIFWGVSFVGMRVVLRELSPAAAMWCRLIVAFAVILPFLRRLKPASYEKGDWKLLLPMVLFQPCLYFLLETNALMLTTSTQAGVIAASVPVFVTIGAAALFREPVNRLTLAGLLLSIAGVVILTISQGTGGDASNPVLGNIMETAAMVFAAANMLLIKKLSGRYSPWTLTAMQVIAGVIFFTPGLFQLIQAGGSIWSLKLVLMILFLGAFVSLGAFGLYNWGISKLKASSASTFINLVPVIAIITGWIFLGEGLTMLQLLAAAGVIIGVVLSQRPSGT